MNKDSSRLEHVLATASFAHPPSSPTVIAPFLKFSHRGSSSHSKPLPFSPIWLVFAKLEFQQTSSLKTKVGRSNPSLTKPLTEARPLRSLAPIWSPCGNGVESRVRVSRPVADTQRNCLLNSWYSNRTVVGQACLGWQWGPGGPYA